MLLLALIMHNNGFVVMCTQCAFFIITRIVLSYLLPTPSDPLYRGLF